jgi:sRNA-binding protein
MIPSRTESEEIIQALALRFPKCFFENPKLRRPLKKDILADLQLEGFSSPSFRSAIEWYKGNFGYQYRLQAGEKRIDLDGKEVDTVTELEQRKAEEYVAERKRGQRDNHQNLAGSPMISHSTPRKGALPPAAPASSPGPLARLKALVEGVDRVLTDTTDPTLRATFGVAGLQTVAAEVQAQIEKMQDGTQP